MKFLLNTFIALLLALSVSAQSNYGSGRESKSNYTTSEDFTTQVKVTNYGYEFDRYDRRLNDGLKDRITKFMKQTTENKYQGNGTFKLHIIKRNGKYFVVKRKQPEELLPM